MNLPPLGELDAQSEPATPEPEDGSRDDGFSPPSPARHASPSEQPEPEFERSPSLVVPLRKGGGGAKGKRKRRSSPDVVVETPAKKRGRPAKAPAKRPRSPVRRSGRTKAKPVSEGTEDIVAISGGSEEDDDGEFMMSGANGGGDPEGEEDDDELGY
jgi:hypothetical protein